MPLLGTHELSVDQKNRLSIPVAVWRNLDKERDGDGFYLLPGRRPNTLYLVPEKTYDRECLQLPALDQLSDETYEYFEFVRSNTVKLDADTQGRVLVPERMLKLAGLTREVALCGVGDRLELWNATEHAAFTKAQWSGYSAKRAAAVAEIQRVRHSEAQNGTNRATPA